LLAQGGKSLLDMFAGSPVFDTDNADRLLTLAGIRCPPVSSYLGTLLERARSGAAAHEVEPLEAVVAAEEDA
jgi:hypothetical protein